MSVVPYTEPTSRQWVELMQPAVELAKAVAGTDFVPKAMRENPAAITAAILYGDEVGIGPMQSLAKIAVIDGRPSLAAEAQRALILAAGHDLWIEESTITRCTIAGRRRGSDATSRVTWSMDDAKRANLAGRSNWRNYPRQMLLARASAELARAVFADAIGGLAATEELEEIVADGPAPALPAGNGDDPKPKAATTRRRRPTAAPAPPVATVSAPPAQPAAADLPPLPGEDEPPAEPPAELPPEPVSEAQRKKLHVLFREHQIDDRDERLTYGSNVIERIILGSVELTKEEASRIIDTLENDPAAGLDEPPPSLLEEELVTDDRADILQWMRRESRRRRRLDSCTTSYRSASNLPTKISRATIKTLTESQAKRLQSALSDAIDAREAQG